MIDFVDNPTLLNCKNIIFVSLLLQVHEYIGNISLDQVETVFFKEMTEWLISYPSISSKMNVHIKWNLKIIFILFISAAYFHGDKTFSFP